MLSLGKEMGHPVDLPTIAKAQAGLTTMRDKGFKDLDWSSFAALARENAGLSLWREGTEDGQAAPK